MTQVEEWRPIQGFEDYSVSSLGRVRRETRGQGTSAGRQLKPHFSDGGYETVALYGEKGAKRVLVHRIVCKAFHDNPNNLPIVRHLDDVRTHNWADNLAWGTHADNASDARNNGALTRSNSNACWRGHDLTVSQNFRINSKGYKVCKPCAKDAKAARMAEGLRPDDKRHGTRNAYREWGCRCEPCTKASRKYNHNWHEEARRRGVR